MQIRTESRTANRSRGFTNRSNPAPIVEALPMSTIDSPEIICEILLNNGTYPGDPQCYSVLTYQNNWNGTSYAITTSRADELRYLPSQFIHNPQLLWDRNQGLTELGGMWLDTYADK